MMPFIFATERATIDKIYGFAEILREAAAMPPDENEYFERPWKWTLEYEAWAAAEKPQPDDPGWPKFLQALEAL